MLNSHFLPRVLSWANCLLFLFFIIGCQGEEKTVAEVAEQEPQEGVIVAVGDSLTAGYGLDEQQAYPALLEAKLRAAGKHYRVVNSGVSGETSSGTLSRIDWILTLNPDIVVLETGANDGLRGQDIQLLQENLNNIIVKLKKAGVEVIFTGMKMVWNLGEEYTTSFNAVYPAVADAHDVIFMEFFLQDVATVPELNLEDGLHPNQAGYKRIVENLFPYVVEAIEELEKMSGPGHPGQSEKSPIHE